MLTTFCVPQAFSRKISWSVEAVASSFHPRGTMRLIVFVTIKKECYATTTVGANESRMKFTSIMPSAAQLVHRKRKLTSLCVKDKDYSANSHCITEMPKAYSIFAIVSRERFSQPFKILDTYC